MSLTNDDKKRLIELLLEDLVILERDAGNKSVTPEPSIIRAIITPILRRWICDRGLIAIRNDALKSPINFSVYDHEEHINACKNKQLSSWTAPLGINEAYISSSHITDMTNQPVFNSQPRDMTLDVGDFCQQKMVYFYGKFATRADIISFAANKLGGTHNPSENEIKKNDLHKFMEEFALAVSGNNVQIMNKTEFLNITKYKKEDRKIYDLYFLVTLDTAHRFIDGIKAIQASLLNQLTLSD